MKGEVLVIRETKMEIVPSQNFQHLRVYLSRNMSDSRGQARKKKKNPHAFCQTGVEQEQAKSKIQDQ